MRKTENKKAMKKGRQRAHVTDHVPSPDIGVMCKLVNQGVVVGREERATVKAVGQLAHHRVGNGGSVICCCSTT